MIIGGRRRLARVVLGALSVAIATYAATPDLPALASVGTSFTTPGTFTYTVPAGVTAIQVDASGAQGGWDQQNRAPGGNGGAVRAVLTVTPGQVLMVDIGADNGGAGHGGPTNYLHAGNGGGATDVRVGACAAAETCDLTTRVVVGGGGGGGGGLASDGESGHPGGAGGTNPDGSGGDGADTYAQAPWSGQGGRGATQSSGGAGGSGGGSVNGSSGVLGNGGNGGGSASQAGPDGGGGDGYYGGGGGGGTTYLGTGGGGGSSFVDPSALSAQYLGGTRGGDGALTISALAGASTSTSLGTSNATPSASQTVDLTATVTGASGTGTVTFISNNAPIPACSAVALSGTTAVCATLWRSIGSYAVVAQYNGAAAILPSRSAVTTETVAQASTATVVSSSASTQSAGTPVTYTATVTPIPTGGTVTFSEDGSSLGSCTGVGVNTTTGLATCPRTYATAGAHTIGAAYSGNTDYAASSASTITETVTAAVTTTTLASSINPAGIGQATLITATVAPPPDAGTVAFSDGAGTLPGCGGVSVNSSTGRATCWFTDTTAETVSIAATYGGDTNYGVSTATPISQTASNTASVWGTPGSYTYTVPPGITSIQVDASGAQGGWDQQNRAPGGNGGAVKAVLTVVPGQVLMIDVGADNGGAGHGGPTNYLHAGNGGGATDVRVGACAAAQTCDLTTRVVVGGGGGGGGGLASDGESGHPGGAGGTNPDGSGGDGADTYAQAPWSGQGGRGATQSSGGAGGSGGGSVNGNAGALGSGGNGAGSGSQAGPDGGGGDGYYGGGGGGGTDYLGTGGGGGSSFVDPSALFAQYLGGTRGGDGTLTITARSGTSTTTTLGTSSATPSASQTVTLTATVSGAPSTGTVTFISNNAPIPTCNAVAVSGGVATCATSWRSVGSYSVVAQYNGTAALLPSRSTALSETVSQASTTTVVVSSASTQSAGSPVTYTATVSPIPTGGSVTFSENGSAVAACTGVAVNTTSGLATCTKTYTTAGSHTIGAAYSGNVDYAASTAIAITETITAAPTTTVLSSSINPAGIGQATLITATVAPPPDAGTVAFSDGAGPLPGCGSVAVDTTTGRATCWFTDTTAETVSIAATYGGDVNYGVSSAAPLAQTAVSAAASWSTPGSYTYTVPAGVTSIEVDAAGAQGGWDQQNRAPGGNGGAVKAVLTVTPGQVLMIDVGGYHGGAGHGGPTNYLGAGNGGGATDLRVGACAAAQTCDLTTRVVVGGGGGGGGGLASDGESGHPGGGGGANADGSGGDGADTYAQAPWSGQGGRGATSTAGGAGGSGGGSVNGNSGVLGAGGNGAGSGGQAGPDGGGGDGYYGGGGGGGTGYLGTGGGGGSSYVTPSAVSAQYLGASQGGDGALTIRPETSLAVTSSANPSTYGQGVTYTATVAPATARGTVQFAFDGVNQGSAVTMSAGIATIVLAGPAVGSHAVTATYIPSGGFVTSSGSMAVAQVVNAATLTITPDNQSISYGQADPAFSFTITGYQNGQNGGVLTSAPTCSVAGAHSVKGAYAIACTGGVASNYVFNHSPTATLTVGAATLTVTPDSQGDTYGQSDPTFTYVITGYQNGESASALSSLPSCSVTGTHLASGTYPITCNGGTAANYSFNEAPTATLTVAKATLTVTPADKSAVYGSADPTFTFSIAGYQYSDSAASLAALPSCTVVGAHAAVAPYAISCAGGTATNYGFSETSTATLTVTAATLIVVPDPQTITYGGADPAFTFTITGYQYTDGAASLTTVPSCSVGGAHATHGTYSIACSGGTAANYTFNDTATATLTVTPATLVVTPNNRGKVYGQSDPTFTYGISGYVNGETAAALTTLPTCGVAGSHTATGGYPITCSGGTAANYVFDDSASATLTVTPATLTVTPNNQTAIYGQSDPTFSFAITGYQYGEGSAALSTSPACTVIGTHIAVGAYPISCSGGTAGNYVFNETAAATFRVGAATLTVTPNPQAISYGQADPTFTYTITGYQHGDTAAALTSSPFCGVFGAHAVKGTYTIVCTGGVAANYVLNDAATATLTVNPAVLTVTPDPHLITIGEPVPAYSYTITGYQYGETAAVLLASPSCSTSGATVVGVFTIHCSGGTATNYTVNDTATASLTIRALYLETTDAFGGLHPVPGATVNMAGAPYWPGSRLARSTVMLPNGAGGYTLDAYGGIHPWGTATASMAASWPGWDIARGIALNPCDATGASGYVLDGYGGMHSFGGAPHVTTSAYWSGWDIAKGLALNPCSGGTVTGYVLDGYGGLHSFSSGAAIANPATSAYWGMVIARSVVVSANGSGYVLDGYGGLHPFGAAPAMGAPFYQPGWDIARGVVLLPGGRGGYVLDGYGGLHVIGDAGVVSTAPGAYWSGWDIAVTQAIG